MDFSFKETILYVENLSVAYDDKVIIKENTPLAIIQNSADYKEVLNLSKDINVINSQDESTLNTNFNKIIDR
mgnify:CR=1 FL=1